MTLIIIKDAPSIDLEPAELLLAIAAFEQQPKLLLMGRGIFYANKQQLEKRENGKSAAKIMPALPMYDCEDIYIRKKDAEYYNFTASDLQPYCTLVDDAAIQSIISQSTHCVSF